MTVMRSSHVHIPHAAAAPGAAAFYWRFLNPPRMFLAHHEMISVNQRSESDHAKVAEGNEGQSQRIVLIHS